MATTSVPLDTGKPYRAASEAWGMLQLEPEVSNAELQAIKSTRRALESARHDAGEAARRAQAAADDAVLAERAPQPRAGSAADWTGAVGRKPTAHWRSCCCSSSSSNGSSNGSSSSSSATQTSQRRRRSVSFAEAEAASEDSLAWLAELQAFRDRPHVSRVHGGAGRAGASRGGGGLAAAARPAGADAPPPPPDDAPPRRYIVPSFTLDERFNLTPIALGNMIAAPCRSAQLTSGHWARSDVPPTLAELGIDERDPGAWPDALRCEVFSVPAGQFEPDPDARRRKRRERIAKRGRSTGLGDVCLYEHLVPDVQHRVLVH